LNKLSYNFLAFVAPLLWSRLLLYVDSIKFFGAMMVVLKVMMLESIIFFALLIVVIVGFLQSFIGLHNSGSAGADTTFVLSSMGKAILQSPEFEGFDDYGHPFGLILYYLFTFIVMVILLNILIALYNQAYTDVTENAVDEYLALFSTKTLQFVRAPDENVFIPPFNLIEVFGLIIPFEWWMAKKTYAKLNDWVMKLVYSPFLVMIAFYEVHVARKVAANRAKGDADDDHMEEWEELRDEVDMESEGWTKKVAANVPNVEEDLSSVGFKGLRKDVKDIKEMVKKVDISNDEFSNEQE